MIWNTLLVLGLFVSFETPLEKGLALAEKQPQEAKQFFEQALESETDKAQANLWLCRLYNRENNYEKALVYGEQAVALLPDSSEAHLQYAQAIRQKMARNSLFAMTKVGTYRDTLAKSISLDPKNLDAREEQIGFFLNAPPIAGGSAEKAKQAIDELKTLDRERGLSQEGSYYSVKKEFEKMHQTYLELQKVDPENGRYSYMTAMALQNMKRFTDAIAVFEAQFDHPQESIRFPSMYQAARSRILGAFDQEKAIEILMRFIQQKPEKIGPSASSAHWRIGVAQEQLNQIEAAISSYEKALELDPKNQSAQKALQRLQ